ncbi:helix-turn-helix transcriptional regulator [Duganella dendranthematis]|uniref:Helix-turn-helix transcriptional regulator n=1 Tax=Duganella dendranthematis TaxID=2728021 RepID=A0ABX6MA97_9BURK|nr:helix-turn-helix transcriptional regulator [Duganella dendranthematis]QJD91244.1 helix-turn-helix transcriptional regulator [Duganella dendranthematis]
MLVEARMSSGMLQADLADKLQKTQSFVSKYERGERRLDFPEFVAIADALSLDLLQFIGEYKARIAKDHPMI